MDKEDQIKNYLPCAKDVLITESQALHDLSESLDNTFNLAVDMMLHCKGRVVITGMGKSGHIGAKMAATLASTGTPAFFVHPAEAAHGDLGMIVQADVVLMLSYSGESEEILTILPALKRKGTHIIAITGRPQSRLAQNADISLITKIQKEACPLGLAPTTSTTVVMALGDALAVALLEARSFTPDDFALSHPAGSLGKSLLIRVSDIMHKGSDLPVVGLDATLKEAILMISQKALGMTAVVDAKGHALGVFTDGDLRRIFQSDGDLKNLSIADVMGTHPKTISQDKLASEALRIMQDHRISGLLVVDDTGILVGAFNMHDLLRVGIV